jgi:tryptophan 2,3-dioxygenase
VLGRDLSQPHEPSPAVQETLIEIYRHDPGAWQICELMLDLDEGLLEWRYRHAVMVERTIGRKPATGQADGSAAPTRAVGRGLFKDLWDIRSEL